VHGAEQRPDALTSEPAECRASDVWQAGNPTGGDEG
jgi:hypothetical protein